MKRLLLLLLLTLFLGGCAKKADEGPAERTVLVYVAAANDLYPYARTNLSDMIDGYGKTNPKKNRLIVYYDTGDGVPRLLQVDASGAHPLQEYPGANSTDPDQLHKVVSQVLQDFPAKSYGLILWSHATGWIPKGFPLAVKNQWSLTAFPATRTFGNQYFEGQRYEIEIPDLTNALPTGAFDFILIDACLMGSVEVAYALREKTDYLIAYPTEVIADGMPYREITATLFSDAPTQDYCRQIAQKFYEHYDAQSGVYRSASRSGEGQSRSRLPAARLHTALRLVLPPVHVRPGRFYRTARHPGPVPNFPAGAGQHRPVPGTHRYVFLAAAGALLRSVGLYPLPAVRRLPPVLPGHPLVSGLLPVNALFPGGISSVKTLFPSPESPPRSILFADREDDFLCLPRKKR